MRACVRVHACACACVSARACEHWRVFVRTRLCCARMQTELRIQQLEEKLQRSGGSGDDKVKELQSKLEALLSEKEEQQAELEAAEEEKYTLASDLEARGGTRSVSLLLPSRLCPSLLLAFTRSLSLSLALTHSLTRSPLSSLSLSLSCSRPTSPFLAISPFPPSPCPPTLISPRDLFH
eukprot:6190312-Pleurochrysis_carterae.AAC.2